MTFCLQRFIQKKGGGNCSKLNKISCVCLFHLSGRTDVSAKSCDLNTSGGDSRSHSISLNVSLPHFTETTTFDMPSNCRLVGVPGM